MTKEELRADKIAGLRCRLMASRREKERKRKPMKNPPCYDDVYFEGVAQLNSQDTCRVHPDAFEESKQELNDANEADWAEDGEL